MNPTKIILILSAFCAISAYAFIGKEEAKIFEVMFEMPMIMKQVDGGSAQWKYK